VHHDGHWIPKHLNAAPYPDEPIKTVIYIHKLDIETKPSDVGSDNDQKSGSGPHIESQASTASYEDSSSTTHHNPEPPEQNPAPTIQRLSFTDLSTLIAADMELCPCLVGMVVVIGETLTPLSRSVQ